MVDDDALRRVTLEGNVEAQQIYPVWDPATPFPLTPLEAWYVLQGWAVKASSEPSRDVLRKLPGRIEVFRGYVVLRQS
jgi:hypothetical protein